MAGRTRFCFILTYWAVQFILTSGDVATSTQPQPYFGPHVCRGIRFGPNYCSPTWLVILAFFFAFMIIVLLIALLLHMKGQQEAAERARRARRRSDDVLDEVTVVPAPAPANKLTVLNLTTLNSSLNSSTSTLVTLDESTTSRSRFQGINTSRSSSNYETTLEASQNLMPPRKASAVPVKAPTGMELNDSPYSNTLY